MQIISGTIMDISKVDPNNKGFIKKIMTIHSTDNQSAFIEFRGSILEMLDELKIEDQVIIALQMKASVSQKSGIQFNNLIAKSIRKINS
jgi:hypothetical protein